MFGKDGFKRPSRYGNPRTDYKRREREAHILSKVKMIHAKFTQNSRNHCANQCSCLVTLLPYSCHIGNYGTRIVQKSFNDCTIPVFNLVKCPSKPRHSDEIVDVNQPTIELMRAIYLPYSCNHDTNQVIIGSNSGHLDPIQNRSILHDWN